jgi:outer membrane lipoprotein-sorting protein
MPRQAGLLALLSAVAMGTSGCLRHTRILEKPLPANVVISASAEQLVQRIDEQYDSIQSLSATVYIRASVGGARKGKVTEYTSVRGFILMRKPDRLRVLGLLPVLETRAFDMASNGDQFTLWMPTKGKAVTGTDTVGKPSANPLENLRPSVFLDSLLIRSVKPDEMVYVTNNTRVVRDPHSKHLMEEPDYDLGILRRMKGSNELFPVRVIYISRADLLPYQQDVYDDSGTLITEATYSDYQDFGQIKFPMKITIQRPQDEYEIGLTIEKLTLNLPLADDQFQLKVPRGTPVKRLP